ncbi:hypothetical protein niasHS_000665 [Heterodera schachtii]|uniref:EGF-like domain-containing protein n=1 Tax=Heterodera schachtii TaxID=97005 RepID=A0ABD2K5B3_HETSC
MTFIGATERRFSFPLLLKLLALFLTFHRLNGAGQIDLTIRHLTLRRAPAGCCSQNSASPIPPLTNCLPNSANLEHGGSACALLFRLCVSSAVDHLSVSPFGTLSHRRNCDIVSHNFSAFVRNARPFDTADRTFVADSPLGVVLRRRFDFSSPLTANVSVHLSVLSANNKLLLFSRFSSQMPSPAEGENAQTFQYVNYGNVLIFQLRAKCADGSVGQKCTEICAPPKAGDHYFCAADGMRCLPGWGGTRCLQPICEQKCTNGGRCVRPNHCECLSGWTGERCDQCIPKKGCQNGFCTDEQPGSCVCLPNWTGSNCDVLVNKCLQKPCKNGGLCTTDGANGDFFRCICPAGFTGRDCAISFANCKNATCAAQNQHCVPLENGFTCVCLPGFAGPNCALPQPNGGRGEGLAKESGPMNGDNLGKHLLGTFSHQSTQSEKDQPTEQKAKSKQILEDQRDSGEMNKIYILIFNGICIVFFLLFGLCVICNCVVRKVKFHHGTEEKKKKPTVSRLISVVAPGGFSSNAKNSVAMKKSQENGGNTPLFQSKRQNSVDAKKSEGQRTGKSFKSLVVRAMAASREEMPQGAADVERQQSVAADNAAGGASPPSTGVSFASGAPPDRSSDSRRPSAVSSFCSQSATSAGRFCSSSASSLCSAASQSADSFDSNENDKKSNEIVNSGKINNQNDRHNHCQRKPWDSNERTNDSIPGNGRGNDMGGQAVTERAEDEQHKRTDWRRNGGRIKAVGDGEGAEEGEEDEVIFL